jgi:hypothetical protein
MITKNIKCPLCHSKLKYHKDGTQALEETDTHIWICTQCPFVGFEYYNPTNITALTKLVT